MNINGDNILKTKVLPKYNCSNCLHFCKVKEIFYSKAMGAYAMECKNFTHPIENCILEGFRGHSEQPSFNQTLNK